MDTLTVVIIGVILLLVVDSYFIQRIRKKRRSDFKLVIEKGTIVETNGMVPAGFLNDIENLLHSHKPENLIINGREINSRAPKLEFLGTASPQLQQKIERLLQQSLQQT